MSTEPRSQRTLRCRHGIQAVLWSVYCSIPIRRAHTTYPDKCAGAVLPHCRRPDSSVETGRQQPLVSLVHLVETGAMLRELARNGEPAVIPPNPPPPQPLATGVMAQATRSLLRPRTGELLAPEHYKQLIGEALAWLSALMRERDSLGAHPLRTLSERMPCVAEGAYLIVAPL